ncbi:MAG: hypothetical protein KDA63_10295 [Planctomycetales bacterium]|nr:hypothetical protein [Planctomycetales bacterium]
MRNRRFASVRICRLVTLAGALSLVGCADKPYELAPVSGVVTLNDQPLVNASVNFQPVAAGTSAAPGPGSFGRTDDRGRFQLRTVDLDAEGAVVGTHRVTVSTPSSNTEIRDDRSYPQDMETLPPEWQDGSKHFAVPAGGTDAANFSIAF